MANRGVRRLSAAASVAVLCVAVLAAAGSPGRLDLGDPAYWLATVAALAAVGVIVWATVALLRRYDKPREAKESKPFDSTGLLTYLFIALVIGAMTWAFFELIPGGGALPPQVVPPQAHPQPRPTLAPNGTPYNGPNIVPYIVILFGLLVLAFLVYVVVNRVRSAPGEVLEPELAVGDPLVAAIEAALIDLEGEDDPRRAVIKAYARMETVLSAQGLPRDPAEAPLEYLDRVLRELGGRASEVDRLTELFEQAAFSKHEVGLAMRDEAVAAFHALRDSLVATAGEGA